MAFIPRTNHVCIECDGPIMRRTNVAAPPGTEDDTYPFLHLDRKDWIGEPHEATPAISGERKAEWEES